MNTEPMSIKKSITLLMRRQDLSESDMMDVIDEIMSGKATPAQIASFITALRFKGETVPEITGAVRVMRQKSKKLSARAGHLLDTCGTGGDGSMTFNISTASAIVASSAGAVVAKHGNRSVSSRSGSADVLAALGVNIEAAVSTVKRCIDEIGLGFLFAPLFHEAMKYAAPVRREIGIRTIFNLVGPLTNPAAAERQLLGVYDARLTDIFAQVLNNLGSKRAFVVHGEDGLDEISLSTETKITELSNGHIDTYHIKPEDFGLCRCDPSQLKGGDSNDNAVIILGILKGDKGPKREIVLLNSAVALMAGGVAASIGEGIRLAGEAIDSGLSLKKLNDLIMITNGG